jgi:hypothetical protein
MVIAGYARAKSFEMGDDHSEGQQFWNMIHWKKLNQVKQIAYSNIQIDI